MFSFEQFPVYQKSQTLYKEITHHILESPSINFIVKDQLHRAALSISLNIAEGSGRHSEGEKRAFYTIARGSVHECAAIIGTLKDLQLLRIDTYHSFYEDLTEISKMLSGLIKAFEKSISPSQRV